MAQWVEVQQFESSHRQILLTLNCTEKTIINKNILGRDWMVFQHLKYGPI